MKLHFRFFQFFLPCFFFLTLLNAQPELAAYYAKITKGEAWESLSRTTEHPDIVVRVNGGQLVFWRGTSYLPYWETDQGSWPVEEVITRSGDGPEQRPDATNSFSFVRIISAGKEEVVVHWRYLPIFKAGNPKKDIDHLTFVDEYFVIQASGKVMRTIEQGTSAVEAWVSGKNLIIQEFQLEGKGITGIITRDNPPDLAALEPQKGNPVLSKSPFPPVLTFHLDEGAGKPVTEAISGEKTLVAGHKAYWKRGISGTALAFDSYTSRIDFPAATVPPLTQFTLEGWVAVGAYPFNWAPILQQSDFGKKGFYLGVGPSGKLGFYLKGKGWEAVTTESELPLRTWTHVAATYDGASARIFVNGEEIASQNISGNFVQAEADLVIGFNTHKQIPGDPVRPDCKHCHTPAYFGFDGLLDEIKVYDLALNPSQIRKSYTAYQAAFDRIDQPDLQERILPMGPSTGNFEAHYTHLRYYDTWDNLARFGDHADVVVEMDDLPTRFIFWRGMSYVPQIVNAENQWYNNQFNESWDAGGSWGEPMSDKQSMRSHVRIIENTPARKVIHWRYAQVQIDGTQQNYDANTGWGDWSDWYYYIYPDGVACKRMVHWSGDNPLEHEWQESIGVMGPGQTPESISEVYDKTVTFDNLKITKSYDWSDLHPEMMIPDVLEKDWESKPLNIQVVNYKSDFKPFTIADFRGGECYGDFDARIAPYSQMVVYIHWPLGQLPTDGTRAFYPDRGSSNGYTHLMFKGSHRLGKNWAERVMLEGMTDLPAPELRPLAKSWLTAPKVSKLEGASGGDYDQAQRAYVFELDEKSKTLDFSIQASEKRPVQNLCFVVKNWDSDETASLQINGQIQSAIRQGNTIDTDGTKTLVIYVELETEEDLSFAITKS